MVRAFYYSKSDLMFAACYPMYRMTLRYKKPSVWIVNLVDISLKDFKPTNGTVYEFPMLQDEPCLSVNTTL